MKVVIIRDMSAGNEAVGEMWKETKIFESSCTLDDVIKWAFPVISQDGKSRQNVTITVPEE